MAELTPSEKLQPALLDRLADDDPDNARETREQRVMSMRRLRESVIRDLGWLLNTHNLESVSPDINTHAHARRSVLNYGMPDLAGRVLTRDDVPALETALREAIWAFEPRLLRNTVRVHVEVDEQRMDRRTLRFHIEAQLWAQPVPEHLFIKTDLDLETGAVQLDSA